MKTKPKIKEYIVLELVRLYNLTVQCIHTVKVLKEKFQSRRELTDAVKAELMAKHATPKNFNDAAFARELEDKKKRPGHPQVGCSWHSTKFSQARTGCSLPPSIEQL